MDSCSLSVSDLSQTNNSGILALVPSLGYFED